MCWTCDRPGSTRADFLEHMAGLVRTYGWAITFVEPDRLRGPWAYTTGLTFRCLPELVITGMPDTEVGPLVNAEASRMLVDGPPLAGERFTLTDGGEAEVVPVAHPEVHLTTTAGLFGGYPFEAIQLVWSDDGCRWPWERGFRGPWGRQMMLGPRAPEP